MNINIKNNDNEVVKYLDTIYSNGNIVLNSLDDDKYTRKSISINTYIDHVITNMNNCTYILNLVDTPLSDHRLFVLSFNNFNFKKPNNENKCKTLTKEIIDYSNIERNPDSLREVCKSSNFDIFHQRFIHLIKNNSKRISIKNKKERKSWMNNDLLGLIKKRNESFKLMNRYPNCNLHKENFQKLKIKARNLKNYLKNYLKKIYYEKEIENNISNNRKM